MKFLTNLSIKIKIIAGTEAFVSDQSEEFDAVPDIFKLYQNHPNPFNPTTVIRYALPQEGNISLTVYDVLGRIVLKPLRDQYTEAGYYEQILDLMDFSSGVYFYHIKVSGSQQFSAVRKMLLVK